MKRNYRAMPPAMMISEQSIRFDFKMSTHQELLQFCHVIEEVQGHFLEDVVPGIDTITVFYRQRLDNPSQLLESLRVKWVQGKEHDLIVKPPLIDVPVCYDEQFSEDMPRVQVHTGLTREEIISLHTRTTYSVYMIGFLPGFPYLGNLTPALHTPRLAQPRLRVAQGTVGIGGTQTGIYPIDSPGGWNSIGRTPLDIYNPKRAMPFLIQAGNQLAFHPISVEAYYDIKEQLEREPARIQQFVKEGI